MLVIFPGALGDLICAGPAIQQIARRHRDAKIELMAKAELARFAPGRMRIARGHSIDRREVGMLFDDRDAAPSEARDFFGAFERIFSFFASGDPRYRRALEQCAPGRATFLPFRPEGEGHIAAGYLRALGIEDDTPEFRLMSAAADLERSRQALDAVGIGPDANFIAIFPGSGSPLKNWPVANYRELVALLLPAIQVAIVLGPAEETGDFAFRGVPILRNLELAVVAGVARLAAAFVGNDSGVSHLAAATRTPGVVIFGPTSPHRWRPLGEVAAVARSDLTAITAAEVHASLRALLKLHGEKRANQTAAR